MKMAILGAGGIAATMAVTIRPLEEVESYAIASRNKEKAQAFADAWDVICVITPLFQICRRQIFLLAFSHRD